MLGFFSREPRTVGAFVESAVRRFDAAEIAYGHGTGNALDEAAFLILETLKLPPDTNLNSIWKQKLNETQREAVRDVIERRIATRKPASYIVNKAYIQGIPFYVDERVIVPRSFIGEILMGMGEPPEFVGKPKRVLDLCTGSGCLAIVAAHAFPDAQIDAIELSPDAADVAQKNIDESGFKNRIELLRGDLFAPAAGRTYDLIITNPPYVDEEGMSLLTPEYEHEPRMALESGKDGLDLTRKILAQASAHLNTGGGLLCEIGRCKPALVRDYPDMKFTWVDTETSSGEVFWITRDHLPGR